MGIVLKQSLWNTSTTYLGFALGAINILFLYTQVLDPEFYGLVTFILATAAILMPLMAFGIHNTMVKFYTEQHEDDKDAFLTLMLLGPMMALIPLALFTWVFDSYISGFLSNENKIAGGYLWYIFFVGAGMAYFEVFFAYSKVHLKSVFGTFMREVFARLCIMVLLILLYLDEISLVFFLQSLIWVYLLRAFIMKLYAFSLRMPKINFDFPEGSGAILSYSLLIILGGSAALILLEIDKFMINQYIAIENVAFYGVAVYIATVVIVPSRAMHQITYPLTAELLNKNNLIELDNLYKKTSLTLFIASGIIFLLIVLNMEDLNLLLPKEYRNGFYIVFLIGLAKVFDSFLGNANSILYNSKYYKTILALGVLLAITTIVLNVLLIPVMGIDGAALASFMAIFLFNIIKMAYIKVKFGFWPFSRGTVQLLFILLALGVLFSFLHIPFSPIINILLKSIVLGALYLGILYRFNISEDVTGLINRYFNKSKQ